LDKYICDVCGFIYDPAIGDAMSSIPAGTSFADLPGNYTCSVCGAPKARFSLVTE
jgi:rubredoxin